MPQQLFEPGNLSLKLGHSIQQFGISGISGSWRGISNSNRDPKRNSHLTIVDPNDTGLDSLLLLRNMQFDVAALHPSQRRKRYWKLESQLRACFGNVAHYAIQ